MSADLGALLAVLVGGKSFALRGLVGAEWSHRLVRDLGDAGAAGRPSRATLQTCNPIIMRIHLLNSPIFPMIYSETQCFLGRSSNKDFTFKLASSAANQTFLLYR